MLLLLQGGDLWHELGQRTLHVRPKRHRGTGRRKRMTTFFLATDCFENTTPRVGAVWSHAVLYTRLERLASLTACLAGA